MDKFLWTFGDIRRKSNLTQSSIGESLGVTGATVGSWERGEYIPKLSPKQMLTLCSLLGLTLEELNQAIDNTQIQK